MAHIPHTKIVATIGPASARASVLQELVEKGVSVARLNMSHGDHEYHSASVNLVRAVEKKAKRPLAILVDLAGPKIRIGDIVGGEMELVVGAELSITTQSCEGTQERVSCNYSALVKEVSVGMHILLDDGKKTLEVIRVTDTEILTRVLVGGMIKSRRGVNIPGARLSIATFTQKDKKDVAWAVDQKVDWIGLSFVRRATDIQELRAYIAKHKGSQRIIAKIETVEAIEELDAIIRETDAVMVARGDLAIEIGPERVPHEQKRIIELCRMYGKPVITATQMLESMTHRPVPSRAEVSDVANAVFDGTDAVMLSEESAMGTYPVEAVTAMERVLFEAEKDVHTRAITIDYADTSNALTCAVVQTALDTDAVAIVALTESGSTARLLSRYRTDLPIYAVTPYAEVARQLVLSFGVTPVVTALTKDVETSASKVMQLLKKTHVVSVEDILVFSAGVPIGRVGSTNTLMVRTVR